MSTQTELEASEILNISDSEELHSGLCRIAKFFRIMTPIWKQRFEDIEQRLQKLEAVNHKTDGCEPHLVCPHCKRELPLLPAFSTLAFEYVYEECPICFGSFSYPTNRVGVKLMLNVEGIRHATD